MMNNPSKLYSDVELNSEVTTASPHRLIQLLLENALRNLKLAKQSVTDNNFNEKYKHLNRARDICEYLRICLDKENNQSKEISTLLERVYIECEKNLVYTAIKNDATYLDRTYQLLANIKESWDGIASQVGQNHG